MNLQSYNIVRGLVFLSLIYSWYYLSFHHGHSVMYDIISLVIFCFNLNFNNWKLSLLVPLACKLNSDF